MKLCFLASGGGGNLKFFHLAQQYSIINNIELYLIADRDCPSLQYARTHDIKNLRINYQQDNNGALKKVLSDINPDVIVSNWNKIIDKEIVSLYHNKMVNLHYSILPLFPGLIGVAPIEAAYRNNCKYTGVTCHIVDEGVDTGGIIGQSIVKIDSNINVIIQKVFRNGCLVLLNSVQLLTGEAVAKHVVSESLDFSPSLNFDESDFSLYFWEHLSRI
ncbi:formyltransferase family protein [Vibrio aestuarianus]|uniref:formyltransferase family protein n=1 Tax=Vibrio aestuarianus TaxID=28171 RepID=UPI00237C9C1F|nr:formyltransferase family protein [Vibrio aestuarianus]MDE1264191.1 hypothetical protein [Vibrio aestuarianus]MDE1296040.1 hypothetical protein [Vibrio aestuarianus]MDE1327131.1 hypothetical protein [Vibrio aestuarianus]